MGQNRSSPKAVFSWRKLDAFFENSPRLSWLFVFLSLVCIGYLDYVTGEEYSFSVFYLIPIAFAAWRMGRGAGIAVSLASAAVWVGIDALLDRQEHGASQISDWNSLVGFAFFLIVSILVSKLSRTLVKEKAGSELKTRMISFVSHEINNSLTSMNMALAILQEDNLTSSPEGREKMYGILASVYSIIRQTSANFLNQARMQEGRFTMSMKMTDPQEAVSVTAGLIRPLIADKAMEFIVSGPSVPVLVLADPDALLLVITNLAGNAVKYTPKNGKVHIRLTLQGEKALFEVEDTGIGMDEEELKQVTAPYYRTDAGKKHAKGFGIGLNLCREIVQAHGSTLHIESKKGRGTKISFTLPASKA